MTTAAAPAVRGGAPIRSVPLPYGRHQLEEADIEAVVASLRSGSLTGGAGIERFERALAERCQVGYAVAVANGTAALHVALDAIGVGPGDDVITTPLTFAASANAALYLGATPVFADVGEDRCLDPGAVAASVTDSTAAVVTVDYAGLPADSVSLRRQMPGNVGVVVDAAHSLGGSLDGRPVGGLGDITTLSFHPVKQITTGEGGACLTDNARLAQDMRRLRNHGMTSAAAERTGTHWQYDIDRLGYNYRLTEMQAALGLAQLGRLEAVVERRNELADRYDQVLRDVPGLKLPPRRQGARSAWHLYAVEIDAGNFGWSRDEVIDGLRAENIQATLHYPAVHRLQLYRDRGYQDGLAPVAEGFADRLVTLPLFPAMEFSDQDDVVSALTRLAEWPASRAG